VRSVVVIIPYFGAWPEWFPLTLASCRANPTIDWRFYTDCPIPRDPPPNTRFTSTTLAAYAARVGARLGIPFAPADAYKLCDVRPAFGEIHAEDIAGYDWFGFGDVDVIYGDLRRFLTDDVLAGDIACTHHQVSGHFTLLRNCRHARRAFRRVPGWRELLGHPTSTRFDEDHFTIAFLPPRERVRRWWSLRRDRRAEVPRAYRVAEAARLVQMCPRDWRRAHFTEQYTTILTPTPWHDGRPDHPDVWTWRDGRLTNARDGEREFIYLHFMNFISARWTRAGEVAAWRGRSPLVHFDPTGFTTGAFRIDRDGFHRLA
jgi:hypothetical protein